MKIVFFLLLLWTSFLKSEVEFGYVSYAGCSNIGDDIQAIAAKRFLPEGSIPIDREFLSEFQHPSKVNTVINGWYMHTKNYLWYRKDIPPPEKSWPFSSSIAPFFISFHLVNDFAKEALTEEGIEYLKEHAPIGARDYSTLKKLQEKNIPSYFSGCLTLTLDNPYQEEDREDTLYLVDLNIRCIAYIKSRTKHKVKVISHGVPLETQLDNEKRIKYAESLLNEYAKAKAVITSRLHATLPCLALKTPVLFVQTASDRLDGLRDLAHSCVISELLNGEVDFDFNHPPPNPDLYLPIRENLIKIMNKWVESLSLD